MINELQNFVYKFWSLHLALQSCQPLEAQISTQHLKN